ncbi:hypothetical protein [Kribbella sp. NBC_00359]|uniref:hypothetical protein n=1 Tax=Kribbella sp. NBC_00359 TaxID=2975966 RepID=UPI002E1E2C8F
MPIRPDDGFPQSFLMSVGERLYRLTFSVSFLTLEPFTPLPPDPEPVPAAELLPPPVPPDLPGERVTLPTPTSRGAGLLYLLPQPDLYLVLKVEREDLPPDRRVLGITRPMLGLPVQFGELQLTFTEIEIARGNLQGPAEFGSRVVAEVDTVG